MYKIIHPGLVNLPAAGDEWEINNGENNFQRKGMEKPLLLCRLVHHKCHTHCNDNEPGPLWRKTGDYLPQLLHVLYGAYFDFGFSGN